MGFMDRIRQHLDPRPSAAAEQPSRVDTMAEIGVTGLNRQGGIIYEEPLRELQGSRWDAAVRDMTHNDTTIGATLFAIESLIAQVPWSVDPKSDAQEDLDAAAFVDECLRTMDDTWEDTLSAILSCLPWGWSLHELVYRRREDGRIVWQGWPIRAQETRHQWEFDETGRVVAMVQQAPPDFQLRTIPLSKALLFRTTATKGNPEGFSMLRRAWRAWNAKRRIENLEGIGIERDLAGLPTLKIPASVIVTGGAVYDAYVNLASNVRRDEQEGIILPSDRDDKGNPLYELSLLSTGGQRQFDTSKVIDRYKVDITMSVLADFLMVGHQQTGSWSLASSKTELFSTALGRWSKMIAAVVNRKAIPDLLMLNGMRGMCELRPGDIETPDLGALGAFIDQMAKAGMPLFPDPQLEDRLRSYAGLPPIPEDRDDQMAAQQQIDDLTAQLEEMQTQQRQQPPEQPPADGEAA